jgi:SAM-dependent methyltransferase
VSAAEPTREQLAANRRLWDERVPVHYASDFYGVDAFKSGATRIRPLELAEIGEVRGRDLLHLQCHFGMDTLSFARLGARVTGVDFSEPAIAQARDLATELGVEARFVVSDVLELDLGETFDIVYTSRGVIGWLPDLGRWARVIAKHLRPGGFFYIHEVHPVLLAFDDSDSATELRLGYPYLARPDALELDVQGTYADRGATFAHRKEYAWIHDLGEIVTALADAGLRIEFLRERTTAPWQALPFLVRSGETGEPGAGEWSLPPGYAGELPLSFTLRARR